MVPCTKCALNCCVLIPSARATVSAKLSLPLLHKSVLLLDYGGIFENAAISFDGKIAERSLKARRKGKGGTRVTAENPLFLQRAREIRVEAD